MQHLLLHYTCVPLNYTFDMSRRTYIFLKNFVNDVLYTLCSSGVLSNMATSNSRVQEISWVQTEKEYKVALKIIKKRICSNCVNSYFLIWTMYISARLRVELLPNRDPILYRISTIFLAKWLRNSDGPLVSSCSGHLKGKVEKNVLIL